MKDKVSIVVPAFLLIVTLELILIFSLPSYPHWPWLPMESGTEQPLYDVWGTSPTDVFAVGSSGTILHYNGNKWSPMTSGTAHNLSGVWGDPFSGNVFAVGTNGTILQYNGNLWEPMCTNTTSLFYGIWGSNSSNIFSVGYNWEEDCGAIWHYDGSTWSPIDNDIRVSLQAVWGSSTNGIFVLGQECMLFHYEEAEWNTMCEGHHSSCYRCTDMWGSSPTDVFIAGCGVLHCNGSNWRNMGGGQLKGIWGISPSSIYAVGIWLGDYGNKYGDVISHYNGITWSEWRNNTHYVLRSIWGSSATDIFVVGQGGTILHYSGDVFSPRIWTGIGVGIVFVIVCIALSIWLLARRRKLISGGNLLQL